MAAMGVVTQFWPYVVAAAASVLLLAFVWWLWWRLPQRYVQNLSLKIRDPKARADVEDNLRKTMGQLLGGIAVLVGAGLAYLQFAGQQGQFSQQQQAARDLLVSNQISKGFEQLGNDKSLTIRLGGIYALEGVMNGSEQYQRPVLEALAAFVREGTKCQSDANRDTKLSPCSGVEPATDIQAAVTVIGRRVAGVRGAAPDLSGAHLPKVVLIAADLSGADLGRADLSGADLSGTRLIGANLNGAHLSGAHLIGAFLGDANLTGANLIGANLIGANLRDADLSGANLSGANLNVADLSGADLRDAYLSGADLSGANLSGAYLSGADLSGANLSGARNLTQGQLNVACGKPKELAPDLRLDRPCPGPPVPTPP